jgi:hypothetical protein
MCQSTDDVHRVRIQCDRGDGRTVKASADLCDKHRQTTPLSEILERFGGKRGAKSKRRVVTPEFIAAQRRKS